MRMYVNKAGRAKHSASVNDLHICRRCYGTQTLNAVVFQQDIRENRRRAGSVYDHGILNTDGSIHLIAHPPCVDGHAPHIVLARKQKHAVYEI